MRCKKCGTDNPVNASYCRNCGFELSAIRKNRASSDAYEADKTVSYGGNSASSDIYEAGKTVSYGRTSATSDAYEEDKMVSYGGNSASSGAREPDRTASFRKNGVPAGYSAEPLSMWAYMGLSILFGIPLAGFICLIVFSCGAVKNVNLVNFARGLLLIEIIVMVLSFLLMYAYGLSITNLINRVVSSY